MSGKFFSYFKETYKGSGISVIVLKNRGLFNFPVKYSFLCSPSSSEFYLNCRRGSVEREIISNKMMKKCELCKSDARIYCDSDQASLCWSCDVRVHSANFLVARHSRSLLCHVCRSPTPWFAAGAKIGMTISVCERCVRGAEKEVGGVTFDGENEAAKPPAASCLSVEVCCGRLCNGGEEISSKRKFVCPDLNSSYDCWASEDGESEVSGSFSSRLLKMPRLAAPVESVLGKGQ